MIRWYSPIEKPICANGTMIPVIVQRNGKVFGCWFCNEYPLYDEYDAIDGMIDNEGFKLASGFCDKVPHSDFDDYVEFSAMHDLQCWAYMPTANEAALRSE